MKFGHFKVFAILCQKHFSCLIYYYFFLGGGLFIFYILFSGCRNFTSMDGIWELRFPICMHPVQTTVAGFEALNYPDVCTNAPFGKGSAFCASPCSTAQERAIPTQLREFLHQYCGVSKRKNGKLLYCHARLCLFLEKAILFRLKGP